MDITPGRQRARRRAPPLPILTIKGLYGSSLRGIVRIRGTLPPTYNVTYKRSHGRLEGTLIEVVTDAASPLPHPWWSLESEPRAQNAR